VAMENPKKWEMGNSWFLGTWNGIAPKEVPNQKFWKMEALDRPPLGTIQYQ